MFSLKVGAIRAPLEHVDYAYSPRALAEGFAREGDPFSVLDPVGLSFDVQKDKDAFRLTGRVQTAVELACSRCLEPFRWPVDAPFDLWYRPLVPDSGGGEREVEEQDLSSAFYEHDEIDLGQLIRERLYLSIPMKPLCEEGCKGLCPTCGANLNQAACNCRSEWEDPRLALLRALKKES